MSLCLTPIDSINLDLTNQCNFQVQKTGDVIPRGKGEIGEKERELNLLALSHSSNKINYSVYLVFSQVTQP